MKANSVNEAWEIAKGIVRNATLNNQLTEHAGYKVYQNEEGEWISDLETRLEINYNSENTMKTVNIWIEEEITDIGIGHIVRSMQMHGMGHMEIMAMRKAMINNDFSKINFIEDIYTEEWKESE